MRIVLLSTAAIALSGCSWLGLGGNNHQGYQQANNYGNYNTQQAKPCCDGTTLSRWNAEVSGGQDFIADGTFINGGAANATGIAASELSFQDAYASGDRFDFGGSYALNPNRKVVLNGYASSFDGSRQNIGTQDGEAITGNISDYDSYGLEAGLRQYFLPMRAPVLRSVRPYVEGRVGAARVDSINVTGVTQTDANGDITNRGNLALYEGGWVPTAAGLVGVETPLFNRMTVGIESGLRYSGRLGADNGSFATESGGGKWTVPVSLRGRYRF